MQHPVKDHEITARGAIAIILNEKNEIAMALRDDMPLWTLIGGGLDPGEDFETGMRRETMEELNIEVDILHFAGDFFFPLEPGKYCHDQIFLCKPKQGQIPVLGDEGITFQWFPADKLPANLDDHDRISIGQVLKKEPPVSMITGFNLVNFLRTVTDFKPFYMLEEWKNHPKVVEKRRLGKLRFDLFS